MTLPMDHREAALAGLGTADKVIPRSGRIFGFVAIGAAAVHALLYIGDRLGGIADRIQLGSNDVSMTIERGRP